MDMFKRVAMRFIRVFVSGAIANILAFLAVNQDFTNKEVYFWALAVAAMTGGLAALDKAFRYVE